MSQDSTPKTTRAAARTGARAGARVRARAGARAGARRAQRAWAWAWAWAAGALGGALALGGCWEEPGAQGCAEGVAEEGTEGLEGGAACGGGAPAEALPAARSPRCLDADGPLCLLSVELDDEAPRRGALTPGERVTLRAVTLVNAQPYPLALRALSARPATAGLRLEGEGVTLLGAVGAPAESPQGGAEAGAEAGAGAGAGAARCEEGALPPFGACRFALEAAFVIAPSAPLNAEQSALVSVSYEPLMGEAGAGEAGAGRAALSLPLLVVDPAAGLRVAAVELDDSTRDGLLQPGDRLRVRALRLENLSLAPFDDVAAHLSPDGAALRLAPEERTVMWEEEGVAVSGLLSTALAACPGARLERVDGEERLAPGECVVPLAGALEVSEEAPVGADARLRVRLKARDERLGGAEEVSFEVRPLDVALALDALLLTADEDGDGALAPGERVTFGALRLLNLSGTAVSLRGRLVSDSPLVEVLSGSDLSVSLEGDGFYEGCGGEGAGAALCEAPVRLRARVSEEAREGDEVSFLAELLDQSGARHHLEWRARVSRPRVALELAELTVTQDSLDPRLSGGERGLVSYLKLLNTGDADALGLRGTLRARSPYLTPLGDGATPEGAEWPIALKEMSARVSAGADPLSGDCLSVERSEGAYCYARLSLPFALSPEAPVGDVVSFELELEDALGQRHALSYALTLH